MTLAIDDLILGDSDQRVATQSSEEVRQGCLALTQQARRTLDIFTQQLDARIYNNLAFAEALKALATYSRHSLIRILIKDSTPVVKQGSRVVQLSYRISSRIQIRKPPIEYHDEAQEFLIADRKGLMHRRLGHRYEGELNFNEALESRRLLKFFDECWEKSGADPELRHLVL